MDRALQERWQSSASPFNGSTLIHDELLHRVVGVTIVRYMLAEIDSQRSIDQQLVVNEDWHVHDGFVKESEFVNKATFLSDLKMDPDKWVRLLDYQVYWALYDPSFQFYLRFGLDEDEPENMMIDLTSSEDLIGELALKLNTRFSTNFRIVEAKPHFDSIYGG